MGFKLKNGKLTCKFKAKSLQKVKVPNYKAKQDKVVDTLNKKTRYKIQGGKK